jgi:hypothetical protein
VFGVEPIGHVRGGRNSPEDDLWGGTRNRPNRIGCTIVRLVGHSHRSPDGPVAQPEWSHEVMRDYWTSAGGE